MPKNLVREPFSVSVISGMERIFASEGYVTIFDFLLIFFCLTVPKNFVGEPFCAVFRKIFGSEKFMHRIGVEYQDFPSETFCLSVPRKFVGKPFSVSLLSGGEEVSDKRGDGEYQDFLSKIFFLTVPKIFVGEPFCAVFQKNFGIEKVYG